MSNFLMRYFWSPFLALNIYWRQEAVDTDAIYSEAPAIVSDVTQAQFYCGQEYLVCDMFGMKIYKQLVNNLEDKIWQRGATDTLLSDSERVEITRRVKYMLRTYIIGKWSSNTYQQRQNPD